MGANLHHPNIVAVHEVGTHDGENYLVMDFVDGPNLSRLVGQKPLETRQAARYVMLMARAIDYAHERSILHRDLKPANVLIDSNDQPRLTDFGLAKRLDAETDLTLSGQVLGSPNFMAPEQATGARSKVNRRTDVYGLGAILYHALTARPPFQGGSLHETLRQVAHAEPLAPRLLNPAIPRDLETICLRCLEKEPARRYATARETAEELARFLGGEPILARPVGPVERGWRWCRRNPVLAAMSFAAIVCASAVGIGSPIALIQISRSREEARREAVSSRRSLYAADMLLAEQSFQEGSVRRAIDLLLKHRPRPGEEDVRGFEWRYLWLLCQKGDALSRLSGRHQTVAGVAWSPQGLVALVGPDGLTQVFDARGWPFPRMGGCWPLPVGTP